MAVSAGTDFSLALRRDGTVWAWGTNSARQLGVDNWFLERRATPEPIPGLTEVVSRSAGEYHAVAVREDGSVWTWGDVLLLGDTDYSYVGTTPVQVPGLSDAVEVTVSFWANLAVRRDGTLWGWGYNDYGQLGNGMGDYQSYPVPVVGLRNAVAVVMGASHTLALHQAGSRWAWGENWGGALGIGTDDSHSTPVRVLDF